LDAATPAGPGHGWQAALAAFLFVAATPLAAAQTAVTSPAMSAVSAVPDLDQTPPPLEDEPPRPAAEPAGTGPLPLVVPTETTAPAPAATPPRSGSSLAALPSGSGLLDSATVQRMIERLVALHFLGNAESGENPDTLVQAIKDFQQSAGIGATGTLDRDTIGRLTTP